MKVVADSSGCCGIKHIRDFYGRPDRIYRSMVTSDGHDEDQTTSEPPAYDMLLEITPDDIESRTYEEAFLFYLERLKFVRTAGMVTVNLASEPGGPAGCGCCDDFEPDSDLVDEWRPIFLREGFTEVTFKNSNSGNIIHHFTLIYGQDD